MCQDLAHQIIIEKTVYRDAGRTKLCIRQKVDGHTLLRRMAHFFKCFLTFTVMSFAVKEKLSLSTYSDQSFSRG